MLECDKVICVRVFNKMLSNDQNFARGWAKVVQRQKRGKQAGADLRQAS